MKRTRPGATAPASSSGSIWQRLRQLLRRLRGAEPAPPGPTEAPGFEAPPPAAVAPLARCVSVIIPALNEERRIASVVQHALADAATAEVIVVDDSSIDETRVRAEAAGARVVLSTLLGKGASMQDGLVEARQEVVVYLDGDLAGLRPGLVGELARPIAEGRADFVKAAFGRGGGRVTELTARPMLQVFFPELAKLQQPLGGLIAARASLLRQLRFEDGYGVDVGLLIDAQRAGARITEVDIGTLEHESQPLADLSAMANEVARVIYLRSRAAGRLHVEQIVRMHEAQREATATLEHALTRRRGRKRLVLLALDGAVTAVPLLDELARRTGHASELRALREHRHGDSVQERLEAEAALLRFVHRQQIEEVARRLPLREGLVAWVNRMRRDGFMVGVIGELDFGAAELLRRRIFADFALAHGLQFEDEVCTGQLLPQPALLPFDAGVPAAPDAVWAARRLREEGGFVELWCVGQLAASAALLREADHAIVLLPAPALRRLAQARGAVRLIEGYEQLLAPPVAERS